MRTTAVGAAASLRVVARAGRGVDRPKAVSRPELPHVGVWGAVPLCQACSHPLAWRGRWECDGCGAATTLDRWCGGHALDLPARGVPAALVRGVPVFTCLLSDNAASSPTDTGIADRQDLLTQLEYATSFFRRRRASRHLSKLGKVDPSGPWARRADGSLHCTEPHGGWGGSYLNRWHEQRYRGQARRFESVRACGAVEYMLEGHDPQTGEVVRFPFERRCNNWRVCPHCLRRRRKRLAREVQATRQRAFAHRRYECSPRYHGPEGRWSERLITLTVPHSGDAGADAAVLARAWEEMQRRLLAHLRQDRGVRCAPGCAGCAPLGECAERESSGRPCARSSGCAACVRDKTLCRLPVWVRSLEVAPSKYADNDGHAHLHIWWVGPFVDHIWLHVTWGRVLESLGVACPQRRWEDVMVNGWIDEKGQKRGIRDTRVRRWCRTRRGVHGRQPSHLPWPHVYVNWNKSGESGAAEYATKVGVAFYITKGVEVQRMHPLHAASVYQALEGRRAVQWASGWAHQRGSDRYWRFSRMTESERNAWLEKNPTRVSSVNRGKIWPMHLVKSADNVETVPSLSTCTTALVSAVASPMPATRDGPTNRLRQASATSQLSIAWLSP